IVELRARRKVDLRLLPPLAVAYMYCHLNRSDIAYVRVSNSDAHRDLGDTLFLSEQQVQCAIAAFFLTYSLPMNAFVRTIAPKKGISILMIGWGATAFLQGFVWSFELLLVCRLFLGVFQSAFFAGVITYFTFWYRPKELASRVSLFMVAIPFSGVIGSFVAFGISTLMDGFLGFESFRWIFMMNGIPPIVIGLLSLGIIPDYPEVAKFLSDQERIAMVSRLSRSGANTYNEPKFSKKDLFAVLKLPQTYMFCLGNLAKLLPFYSLIFILPTIIHELGYEDWKAILMCAPPYLAAMSSMVGIAFWSDRRGSRIVPLLLFALIGLLGFFSLLVLENPVLKYLSFFLACIGNFSTGPIYIALINERYRGAVKVSVMVTLVTFTGSLAGVFSAFVYSSDSYESGHLSSY
ncbi:MAG: hypothetical protein SGCHY_000769, partial [Lobulomycetales sp.]